MARNEFSVFNLITGLRPGTVVEFLASGEDVTLSIGILVRQPVGGVDIHKVIWLGEDKSYAVTVLCVVMEWSLTNILKGASGFGIVGLNW